MISPSAIKVSSSGRVLVRRFTGASGGSVRPVRRHYGLRGSYVVDPANGSGSFSVSFVFPDDRYDVLATEPAWAHHRFIGWFDQAGTPDVAGTTSGDVVSSSDLVLYERPAVYAQWQLPTTVEFDAATGGGSMDPWSADYYEGQPFESLPTPTHATKFFTGWYLDGARVRASDIVPVGGGTLVARFLEVTMRFRYIRVRITKKRSPTNVMQFSEVKLLDSNGNAFAWPSGTTVFDTMSGYNAKGYGNGEMPINIIDGSTATKLCCNSGIPSSQTLDYSAYIDLGAGNAVDASVYSRWQWYTANDASERDPVSFSLSGSNDGEAWTLLDSAENASITISRYALAYTGNLVPEGGS